MKVKPVMDALERRGVTTFLVHTGQHYDPLLSDVFFEELGIRKPDRHLGVGSASHARQTALIMIGFEEVVQEIRPDVVVVVGDVNSTMACALVAAKEATAVAHVEAGLRSGDWTMPEEVNRVVTDRVSDHLLAPSPDAVENLRREGLAEERIHLVGNVMVDTLLANLERARQRPILSDMGLRPRAFGVVTLHRPSNVDDPARLDCLMATFEEISTELPLILPAHPRTQAQLGGRKRAASLRVVPPLGYLDFLALQAAARLVLTDSGGIQEETTVLGVPCLTLRETTERPITVTEGTNRVVTSDPSLVLEAVRNVLRNGVGRRRPALWDGRAGERVADVLTGQEKFHPDGVVASHE
jgi:UDP-N-acetylglucosamine 2-epimerase (non-hydrolysing)